MVYSKNSKPIAQVVPLAETKHFDREDFSGDIFVDKDVALGFTALLVTVEGAHPRKRMLEGTTRMYHVISGEGSFTLDDTTHSVTAGDTYVIPAGAEYEYKGAMQLFEVNISPDNTFRDEKL